MELDLLAAAETESDSESNHSNQDNASGRRSVVTAATAGSEAGWSTAFFYFFLITLRISFLLNFLSLTNCPCLLAFFCGNVITCLIYLLKLCPSRAKAVTRAGGCGFGLIYFYLYRDKLNVIFHTFLIIIEYI